MEKLSAFDYRCDFMLLARWLFHNNKKNHQIREFHFRGYDPLVLCQHVFYTTCRCFVAILGKLLYILITLVLRIKIVMLLVFTKKDETLFVIVINTAGQRCCILISSYIYLAIFSSNSLAQLNEFKTIHELKPQQYDARITTSNFLHKHAHKDSKSF